MKAEYLYYAGNNYLKLDLRKTEEDYRVQMLLSRKIQGLPAFEKNSVNGESRYLYLISGKQSIRSRYSLRPFTREVYYNLLESFFCLVKLLEEYLLDIKDVILDPDFIFQDMETKEISFIYYPEYDKSLSENFLDFYLFLLEHVDTTDEEFVKEVYLTYDKIDEAGEFFHISMLKLPVLENKKKEEIVNIPTEPETAYEDKSEETNIEENSEKSKLWILFLLDAICFYFLWNRFSVTDYQFLLSAAGILIINAAVFFVRKFNKKLQTKEDVIQSDCEERVPESFVQYSDKEESSANDYGKTIFLDPNSVPEEKRLYGMGKENAYVLSLEKTPYTIGKEKEFVDGILSHESVSRMHARVSEEENRLYLEDLNSTNGTFKNGIRLNPLEKVELEAGDEVKFGILRFTYR